MTRSNICANELGSGSNMRYKSNIGSIEHRFYLAEVYVAEVYVAEVLSNRVRRFHRGVMR
jgi:hypothetical protein